MEELTRSQQQHYIADRSKGKHIGNTFNTCETSHLQIIIYNILKLYNLNHHELLVSVIGQHFKPFGYF